VQASKPVEPAVANAHLLLRRENERADSVSASPNPLSLLLPQRWRF
jgi:hypothetical protein